MALVAFLVTAIIAAVRIAFAFTIITVRNTVAVISIAVVVIMFAFAIILAFAILLIIGTAIFSTP